MSDPYKVLGLKETATDAEIKAAYYDAVRKYHPDQYRDNPLSDLAEEKLKEINEAYDTIQRMRKEGSGNAGQAYSSAESARRASSGSGIYASVRARINAGDIAGAEAMLNGIPERNAEWYYLMGTVYRMKGWHEEAERCFAKSYGMNPDNGEYARAYNESASRAGYYTTASTRGSSGPGACSCLSNLCLADCCCECMGGDLIPCC